MNVAVADMTEADYGKPTIRFKLLHPIELTQSQDVSRSVESLVEELGDKPLSDELLLCWAEHYFTAVWIARSGTAGTERELHAPLAMRWDAGGGDSVTRYHNAIRSLNQWRSTLRRASFDTLDVFAFLEKCKDRPRHGIYCDQPFPGPGDRYKHTFSEEQTRALAERLTAFEQARIVCRYYDHPLVREVYPEEHWHWQHLNGRKQTNAPAPEVLLSRGES